MNFVASNRWQGPWPPEPRPWGWPRFLVVWGSLGFVLGFFGARVLM